MIHDADPTDPPASTRYAGDSRRDARRALYEGRYDNSWAVLIGIDRYRKGYLDGKQVVYPSADLDLQGDRRLTERDIDELMGSIPAKDRLLVTDGQHLGPGDAGAQHRYRYRFLYACRQREKRWEIRTRDGEARGAFTHAFESAVRALGNASIAQIMAQIQAELSDPQRPQTPGYTGSGALRLFQSPPDELEIIELAEQSYGPFAIERISEFIGCLTEAERRAEADSRSLAMAPLWLAVGRAWLAQRDEDSAILALERVRSAEALLPLVRAKLLRDRCTEAINSWTAWRNSPPNPRAPWRCHGQSGE